MAYESVNVDSLNSALDDLLSKIPDTKVKLLESVEGLDETNWKSDVRTSTTGKVERIGERIDTLTPAINSYKSILANIRTYQEKQKELQAARAELSSNQAQLNHFQNNDTSLDFAVVWYYQSQVSKWQDNVDRLTRELNSLHKAIEGASI